METLEPLLRKHPFLSTLGDDEIRFLVGCASNRRFGAGELLFREGGEAAEFFLLRGGRVSLEVNVPGREPFQLESCGEGDVVGWSWLFPPHRWQLDARAIEPVMALVFEGRCLREKMEQDQRLGYALAKLMLFQVYQRLTRVRLQRLDLYRNEP
jgi:CRP/FNR family cyclic AMP-dependent transcriptional regulator